MGRVAKVTLAKRRSSNPAGYVWVSGRFKDKKRAIPRLRRTTSIKYVSRSSIAKSVN